MNSKTIEYVRKEANRFLDRLSEVMAIELSNEAKVREVEESGKGYAYENKGTRKHGAFRRAAHDLKEALTLITQNKDLL